LITRFFDIVVSLLGLLVLAPVFAIVSTLIKLDSSGPLFFRQERIGKGFRPFKIYKFRIMQEEHSPKDAPSMFSQQHQITRVGGFLRKTKINELPQLINVLIGEMSLVGPRPELQEFVHMFRGKYMKILTVRPGITDLASLEYINEARVLMNSANPKEEYINKILPEKIRLAMVYVDRASFFLNIKIIFKTIFRVVFPGPLNWKSFKVSPQGVVFFFMDSLFGIVSFYLAFLLRYDGAIPVVELDVIIYLLPFILFARALAWCCCQFYSRLWEYSSLEDLILIVRGTLLGSLILILIIFLHSNPPISLPRSIPIIDFFLLISMLGGSRMGWRMWNELQKRTLVKKESGIRTLIFGAGDTGALLLKNLRSKFPHFTVCGFIDDNPDTKNKALMGVRVLGNRSDIPALVSNLEIKEILIAMKNISSDSLSEIVEICSKSVVKFKIVSSVADTSTNELHLSKIRKMEISDLLGRDSVSLDWSAIKSMISGKRVLVTGAGGSIGSELCSQILEFQPSELIMVDRGENYLYELNIALNSVNNSEGVRTKKYYKFCSITNRKKMDSIFSQYRPQLVFHAAANKHVPLMEENVDEAVVNNIYGTKITVDISDKYEVERFVMVSTDKVIRPTSVMGATKKIAEKYVEYMNEKSKTKFVTVRFGNVLGSKGSVIPFFQNQIENGGPVTVTHPDMTRYFMLIPEAVQLILQSAEIGQGGEIFVLEMGEPVKIVDLARKMIRLAGYELDKDIQIIFTGIRPGEKMHEELVDEYDEVMETAHKKIKVLKSQSPLNENFKDKVDELVRMALTESFTKIKMYLRDIIHQNKSDVQWSSGTEQGVTGSSDKEKLLH
jgi:FlaA1/EpsC-like NDP-sugar epimerase/lipopolysaccharide/colanic/teichoic acid biosynthesis glycosyltransferase